jgi:hypothetical protein
MPQRLGQRPPGLRRCGSDRRYPGPVARRRDVAQAPGDDRTLIVDLGFRRREFRDSVVSQQLSPSHLCYRKRRVAVCPTRWSEGDLWLPASCRIPQACRRTD